MSTSTYKSFAVIGAGVIGTPIAKALLASNVPVVILSRLGSTSSNEFPPGAKVVSVSYNDIAGITKVLAEHKVDVVISTVGSQGIVTQPDLARASKDAGVKLFVPSEFGVPTEGHTEGFLGTKNAVVAKMTEIGMPTARFYVGFFIEYIPFLFGFPETGKINIVGKGRSPLSFTAMDDIAGFVAHVLTTLPPAELVNKSFRLEGDRGTLLEFASLFDAPVVHVDKVPAEANNADVATMLQEYIEMRWASTGWDEAQKKDLGTAGSSNGLWQDHRWRGVAEILKAPKI